MTAPDPRAALRADLREAIAHRDIVRSVCSEAADALARAGEVLNEARADLERHAAVAAAAQRSGTADVAAAIRRGARPSVELSAEARSALRALDEARARASIAEAAHGDLSGEARASDASLRNAEADIAGAALDVVLADVEIVAASKIETLFNELCAAHDLVAALAMVPGARHTPALREIQPFVHRIAAFIGSARPQRPGFWPSNAAIAAMRLRDYVRALTDEPETQLADVPIPELPKPPPPMFRVPEADAAAE